MADFNKFQGNKDVADAAESTDGVFAAGNLLKSAIISMVYVEKALKMSVKLIYL